MSVFRKGITICYVLQDDDESYEHFIDRGNFIVSQAPNNDKEYNEALMYSRFHINNKILKCRYNPNIMQKLDKMRKNCVI